MNPMPPRDALTEEHVQLAALICEDEKTISDGAGYHNKHKWERVKEVFKADKATIFSDINYQDWFHKDDPRTCEAASFMADLRVQWLTKMLEDYPASFGLHNFYLVNQQWYVRLRERARMHVLGELIKRHGKLI